MRLSPSILLALSGGAAAVSVAWAQTPAPAPAPSPQFHWPEKMRNAKVLKGLTADQLRDTMKGAAMSLGVRCTFCHAGTEGMSLAQIDFASDANPRKLVARGMMRMVGRLNKDLPRFAGPKARVTCYTCHRGSAKPLLGPPPPVLPTP